MPQLASHHNGGTHQLSVKRVQGEPESHSAPLAFGDRLHPVGVLTTRREADHSPALGLDGGLQGNSNARLARSSTAAHAGYGQAQHGPGPGTSLDIPLHRPRTC